MRKNYSVGVDGGGTKTTAVLLDDESKEIARGVGGPSNQYTVGVEVAEASVEEAISQVLTSAGLAIGDVTAIGLGMAGVDQPGDIDVVRSMVANIGSFSHVVVTGDAETALVGGVGRRHGVVLIAGTGAIAYGVNAQGRDMRADGLGYLAGDEGSAHWIGMEGLRAVARAHDGRGPATLLEGRLLQHLGLADGSMVVTLVYGDDFGVPELAGLASLVGQAALDGDVVAQDILREAGERLGTSISAVIRGLDMTAEVFEVVLVGGVLQARGLVWETVVARLGDVAPRARVIEPRHDAAVGAALLARGNGYANNLGG